MATNTQILEHFEAGGLDITEALILCRMHNGIKEVKSLSLGIKLHVFTRRISWLKRKHRFIEKLIVDQEADGRLAQYILSEKGREFMAKLPP